MDEYVDILDDQGNYTGKSILKSEAHKLGLLHPTIHVWLFTSDGKILLQKRAAGKNTFPGLWDVSVAGHISAGEAVIPSALREVEEELGMIIDASALTKIGTYKQISKHGDLIDAEYHHIFISPFTSQIDQLTLQTSEVEDVKLILLEDFISLINNRTNSKSYVVLDRDYYNIVFDALRKVVKM